MTSSTSVLAIATTAPWVLACGSESSPCENVVPVTVACDAALRFAARSTTELTPSSAEIEDYYRRWEATITAEPILAKRVPQTYRLTPWISLEIWTINPLVISSWTSGNITTNVPKMDDTINALIHPQLRSFFHDNGDGTYYFLLDVDGIYSEEILNNRLAEAESWLPDPVHYHRDDGTWTWLPDGSSNGRTARIEFRFGWGDCWVACDGYRTLVSIVDENGRASVYDAGGDPLPEGMELSKDTLPINDLR